MADHDTIRMLDKLEHINEWLGKIHRGFRDGNFRNGPPSPANTFQMGASQATLTKQHFEWLSKSNQQMERGISSLRNLSDGFARLTRVLSFTAVEEAVRGFTNHLTQTYQSLNEYGQTFGGSILNMQLAAANAQLPLEQFSKAVRDNSAVISTVGTRRFFDLNKTLRSNIERFGMFGMTLEQVNELQHDYMETQRLWGTLNTLNDRQAAAAMADLAEETSALAALTGKNRTEMRRQMMQAQQDVSYRLRVQQMGARLTAEQERSMNTAMAMFASQMGAAGQMLPQMLAQTFGTGSAIFADQAQQFIDAGAGSLLPAFDRLNAMMKSGAPEEALASFTEDLKRQMDALRPTLDVQIASGNQAARAIGDMITNFKAFNAEQLRSSHAAERDKQVLTRLMNNLEQLFARISGRIRTSFLNALDQATRWLSKPEMEAAFDSVGVRMGELAATLGTFLGDVLRPESIRRIGDMFGMVVRGGIAVAEAFFSIVNSEWFTTGMRWLGVAIGTLIDWITSAANNLKSMDEWLSRYVNPELAHFVTGLAAFGALMIGKRMLGFFTNLLTQTRQMGFQIQNATIHVANGAGLGATGGTAVGGAPGTGTAAGGGAPRAEGRMADLGRRIGSAKQRLFGWATSMGGANVLANSVGGLVSIGETVFDATKTQQEKMQGVIETVFGTAGGILGGVLGGTFGSALGPLGTIGGSMAGSWAGGEGGAWLGRQFNNLVFGRPTSGIGQVGSPSTGAAPGLPQVADAGRQQQDLAEQMRRAADAAEETRRLQEQQLGINAAGTQRVVRTLQTNDRNASERIGY